MIIRNLFIIAIILFQGALLNAQLKLIPEPKITEIKNSNFRLDKKTVIASNDLDSFYANEIINCIKQNLGILIKPVAKASSNCIQLINVPDAEDFEHTLKTLMLPSDHIHNTESYILQITKKTVKIISQSSAGIFYGIQTLKQLIEANSIGERIPCLIIYDFPDIQIRAWQDDISRGPIPTMDMLKQQIKKMASYKLNFFTMYIEHVFQLEKHPGIAPEDGISKTQIDELSEFADKYHVTLIGNYQSFGHMAHTLSHPDYQHLAENSHIISPALKESYDFLQDVYQEIVPAFNGEYFNINCDETFGLAEGRSKSLIDSIGIDGVYLSHINKLNAILKPFNKRILMWGDIVSSYPQIISQLPEDITVMAWGYHAADNFEYAITPISDQGLNFWVAPGINCWSNIYPNYHATEINVYNFIRDGYKHNASGVLNTSWDDDGLNFFQNNWHGLIWGAENSWNAPSSDTSIAESNKERSNKYNSFNRAYDAIFFGLKEDSLVTDIIAFSKMHQSGVRDILRNKRFFEPIFPIHLDYVAEGKQDENLELLIQLDGMSNRIEEVNLIVHNNNITIDYLKFAIRQVQFSLKKNLLRINLYNYLKGDNDLSVFDLKNAIETLITEAQSLKLQYIVLWNKENRNWWLDENIKKFDQLIEDLGNLKAYCIISPHKKLSELGRKISMRSLFGDLPVYYTLNEDTVDRHSTKYEGSFFINDDMDIKARVIDGTIAYPIAECNIIYHNGIGKLHRLNSNYSKYHPSYDGGGQYALLDGIQGNSKDLRSGSWQGFSGQNIDIEIDMGKVQAIHSFSMGFYQNTHSWVIFPKEIEIYFKNEIDEEYKHIKTINNKIPPEAEGNLKHNYETEFHGTEARYLKVVAYYYGKLPEWHHAGSKYESMIFSDEIILK